MTDAIEVVAAQSRDVDAIMPIMASAFDPIFGEAWTAAQCVGILSLPGTILFIAYQHSRPVGFALARSVLDESELLLIATTSESQRQGIGLRLIESVIGWSRKNSVKKVMIEVRSGNPALALYTKVGFTEVGRRENYYHGLENNRFDALTLQLDISSFVNL